MILTRSTYSLNLNLAFKIQNTIVHVSNYDAKIQISKKKRNPFSRLIFNVRSLFDKISDLVSFVVDLEMNFKIFIHN